MLLHIVVENDDMVLPHHHARAFWNLDRTGGASTRELKQYIPSMMKKRFSSVLSKHADCLLNREEAHTIVDPSHFRPQLQKLAKLSFLNKSRVVLLATLSKNTVN